MIAFFIALLGTGFSATVEQTISFTGPADQVYQANPITLSATASSGLPVTFSLVSGPATISGSELRLTGVGTVKVRAAQVGNALYYAATSVERSFAVSRKTVAITWANLATVYDGTAQPAAVVTTPENLPVSVTYAGGTTVPIAAGSYEVVATVDTPLYQGSATATKVIGKAAAVIDFPALADRPFRNRPFTLQARGNCPAAIAFTIVSGPATLSDIGPTTTYYTDANGIVVVDPTPVSPMDPPVHPLQNEYLQVTGPGVVVVRATQPGNGNYEAADAVERSFTVTETTLDPEWFAPEIRVQPPVSVQATDGVWVSFSLYAIGHPSGYAWTRQWQYRATPAGPWINVVDTVDGMTGADSNYLSFAGRLALSGYQFRCVISNAVATVYSRITTLTVGPRAPSIEYFAHPKDQYVRVGGSATFTVTATGSAPFSYQWRRNGVNIPGANQASYTIENVPANGAASYSVVVSNAAGSITSNSAALTLGPLPTLVQWPRDAVVPQNGSFTYYVSYSSTGPATVQWFRNGSPITANGNELRFTSVQPGDAGVYHVTITNSVGTVSTPPATMTVVPEPVPGQSNASLVQSVNPTSGLSLSSAATGVRPAGQNNFTYQWYFKGEPIAGATAADYMVPAGNVSRLGEYFVTITNSVGTTVGQTVTVDDTSELVAKTTDWLEVRKVDGILYFLHAAPARIERFNLATRSWLPAWDLPWAPVGFEITADALLVAFTDRVIRYPRDYLGSQDLIAVTPTRSIIALGILGDCLVVVEQKSGSAEIFYRSHTLAGTFIAETSAYYGPRVGLAFAKAGRRIFGRDYGSATLNSIKMKPDGTWEPVGSQGNGLAGSSGRAMSLGNGAVVVEASGRFFAADDHRVLAGNGGRVDDAITGSSSGYYVLRPGRVTRLDAEFRPLGDAPLSVRGARLFEHEGVLLVFRPPAAGEKAAWEEVPIAALVPPALGPAVNPVGLAMWSPQILADTEGNLAIYSKVHRQIFRWSAASWSYQGGVRVPTNPNTVTLAPVTQSIFYDAGPSSLNRVSLADGGVGPFKAGAGIIDSLLATGTVVLAEYSSGDTSGLFVDGGVAMMGRGESHAGQRLAWSPANRRIYTLPRNGSDSFYYRQLSADARAIENNGSAPYPVNDTYVRPISVAPDGAFVLLGSGKVLEQAQRTVVATLAAGVVDATWTGEALHVVRHELAGAEVASYARGGWQRTARAIFDGTPLALISLRGDRLLLVTAQAGVPNYRMLDAATLAEIDPAGPEPLAITRQPEDARGEVNVPLLLQVTTRGGSMPDYQWQIRLAGTTTWANLNDSDNIHGAQSGRLVVMRQPAAWSGARFRVVVTNATGTVTSAPAVVTASGQAGVVAVEVGLGASTGGHAVFTRADGSIWTLGQNEQGQIGDGSAELRTKPFLLALEGAAQAGQQITFVIKPDGGLWLTGDYPSGFNAAVSSRTLQPLAMRAVRAYASNYYGLSTLGEDGTAWLDNGQPRLSLAEDVNDYVAVENTRYFLRADGSLWGMGGNSSGQLGDGTKVAWETPRLIQAGVKRVCTSGGLTFFIKQDDTLWAMGENFNGQLGNGTRVDQLTPVQIDSDVRTVATGGAHSLYVKRDGSVWAMGSNSDGQLGDGTLEFRLVPVRVADNGLAVAAGSGVSCLVKTDGSLWAAGQNRTGIFGPKTDLNRDSRSVNWELVASGDLRPPAVPQSLQATDGSRSAGVRLNWTPAPGATGYEVWRSPTNQFAQAELLTNEVILPLYYDATTAPGETYYYWVRSVSPAGPSVFSAMESGSRGTAAAPVITRQPEDSEMVLPVSVSLRVEATGDPGPAYRWQIEGLDGSGWANMSEGYPFNGTRTPVLRVDDLSPTQGPRRFRCVLTNAVAEVISAPAIITVKTVTGAPTIPSRTPSASVKLGSYYRFDAVVSNGSTNVTYVWRKGGIPIPGATASSYVINSVAAGDAGTYTFVATNALGSTESGPTVLTVTPASMTRAIAAGNDYSIFVQTDGDVRGMGANTLRQIGVFSDTATLAVPHGGVSGNYIAVASGGSHSLFLNGAGAVSGGGATTYGQAFSGFGVYFNGFTDGVAVAAGGAHSLVLKKDGTVWAVGLNDAGQLGDGTTTNRLSPVQVATGVRAIAAGGKQSYYIKDDDSLWATGANGQGQLGDGTTVNRSSPVQIAADVRTVAAGTDHALFVGWDGMLWGMGSNASGKLGDGLPLAGSAASPFPIATGVAACAAGPGHSAYIKADGSLWMMGRNDRGQLGRGTFSVAEATPAQVRAGVVDVAVGLNHTLFLDEARALWGVGDNAARQLGVTLAGTQTATPVRLWETRYYDPQQVPGLLTALPVAQSTAMRLYWTGVSQAVNYTVYRGPSSVFAEAVPIASELRNSLYLDRAAGPGPLFYWVEAIAPDLSVTRSNPVLARAAPNGAPVIAWPQTTTVSGNIGGTVSFSINATGSATMTYQLRRNGVVIGSPTTYGPQLSNLRAEDAGEYEVVVSNSVGSAVSAPIQLSLVLPTQAISFVLPQTYEYTAQAIPLTATASSGLPVEYTVVSGPASITGNQLTLQSLGLVTVTAKQEGNMYFAPATPVTQSFFVAKGRLAPVLGNLVQVYNGQPKPVSLVGLPAGAAASVRYDGESAAPVAGGNYGVEVRIDDALYQGVATGTLTIQPATQTIAFPALADRYFNRTPFALSATATSGLPVTFGVVTGPATVGFDFLTLHGLGFVTVRASVSGNANYDRAEAVERSFSVLPGMGSWEEMHFTAEELADVAISGPGADPDGDGLPNLVEYALGLGPKVANASELPAVSTTTEWTYTYTRPADRADINYAVEVSADLSSWSTGGVTHALVSTAGGVETWRATYPLGSAGNVFFRLKVTQL